jgi:hypothetical protein
MAAALDRNGKELKPRDHVSLTGRILAVYGAKGDYKVDIELLAATPAADSMKVSGVATHLVEKVSV